jgi:Pyruvate/2-oxoacid:ferredoxin oxidoreductase delta subunit
VEGVALAPVRRVFTPDGRFDPEVDDSVPPTVLPCDLVIFAVGQEADTSFLPASLVRGSLAAVQGATLQTAHARVWAGGDIAFGPRHLIDAIADGRRAAEGIGRALARAPGAGGEPDVPGASPTVRVRAATPWRRVWSDYDARARAELPVASAPGRDAVTLVEQVLDDEAAVREAQRCLRCHANVTLRADRCILCGLCADVCPERCIRLEPAGDGRVALTLDEAHCIRCGLCVERCPPQALTMVEVELA